MKDWTIHVHGPQTFHDELLVDSHNHLDRMTDFFLPGEGHSAEGLIDYMDYLGIDRICAFSYAGIGSDFAYGNDSVAAAARRYPGRIIGYVSLNLNYPETWLPELERGEARGMLGIKLHPSWQGFADPPAVDIRPIMDWANQKHRVIINHWWGPEAYVEKLAHEFPNAVMIHGHTAYPYLAAKLPNFYVNTCLTPEYGGLEGLVRAAGAEKVVWGSDMPDCDVPLGIGPILFAPFSDDEKRAILGRNMQRILEECGMV